MTWMMILARFGNRAAVQLGLYSVQTPGVAQLSVQDGVQTRGHADRANLGTMGTMGTMGAMSVCSPS